MDAWQAALDAQTDDGDDQAALQTLVLDGSVSLPFAIRVDWGCVLFQTGWGTRLERGGWESPDASGPFLRQDGTLFNSETGTEPLFAHFNGDKVHFINAARFGYERHESHVFEASWRSFAKEHPAAVGQCPGWPEA